MPKKHAQRKKSGTTVRILHRIRSGLLAILLALLDLVGQDAVVFARALVDLALIPCALTLGFELVAAGTELGNGLLRQQLFERPFLNILLFILLELGYELYSPLQNGALVLFAAWHNLGQFVDTLVNGLAATAFNCVRVSREALECEDMHIPSL